MAQKASKQQATRNTQILNRTLYLTLAIHGFFFLFRAILFYSSFTRRSALLYLLTVPQLAIQFFFERNSRPKYGAQPGQIQRAGEDLEAKGLTEWMWDIIYWTYMCTILAAVFGDYAWWAYIAVPLYSAYLGYTTFTGARSGMMGLSGNTAADHADADAKQQSAAQSKTQAKREKRGGQRVQYR